MSDQNLTNFNIHASLRRIKRIINSNPRNKIEEKRYIPSKSYMTFENGCYVQCVALHVDIRDSSRLPQVHQKPVLAKIYRAYISEISALMRSCKLNKHIHIHGDAVLGIFNAHPSLTQKHVQEIFELGARISSLLVILNDSLKKKNYQEICVGIGIAYGQALMIKAGLIGSGINEIVWMGDVINTASKLGNAGNKREEDKQYMICSSVWDALPNNYTDSLESERLITWNSHYGCYNGSILHSKSEMIYQRIKNANKT